MTTVDIKALNKVASNCGTSFIRDKRGQLSTKSPLVWKNAAWLQLALMQLGFDPSERRAADKTRYYIVLEGL